MEGCAGGLVRFMWFFFVFFLFSYCFPFKADAVKTSLACSLFSRVFLPLIPPPCVLALSVLVMFVMHAKFIFISFSVDVWSVGCIMAEMVRGSVLFPGTDRILTCLFLLIHAVPSFTF